METGTLDGRQQDEEPDGEEPDGERPDAEMQQESIEKPSGEPLAAKQLDAEKKPEGEKPEGEKPEGEKPEGEKPPGEKSEAVTKLFDGRWLGEEGGEYCATIKGLQISWPDGSTKPLQVDLAAGSLSTEVEGEVYSAKLLPDGRLEFSDGDMWVRSKKTSKKDQGKAPAEKKRRVAKAKEKKAPRKAKEKAPAVPKNRRFQVTSANRVGLLPKPDISAQVHDYLMPGTIFAVTDEWVDSSANRRFFFLADGRGWVSECSRKDPNKKVLTEQLVYKPKSKDGVVSAAAELSPVVADDAAEEAEAAPLAAAADQEEEETQEEEEEAAGPPVVQDDAEAEPEPADPPPPPEEEDSEDDKPLQAAQPAEEEDMTEDDLPLLPGQTQKELSRPPQTGARERSRSAPRQRSPSAPRQPKPPPPRLQKHEVESQLEKEVEDLQTAEELLRTGEALAASGDIPEICADQFASLMKLPLTKLKAMLKGAWLPLEGTKQRLAVRLVRYLSDWAPSQADAEIFEAAGMVAPAPVRRVRGKQKAPPISAPVEPPKAPPKKARPVTAAALVAAGCIPKDAVERYEALMTVGLADLQDMAEQVWLSSEGTPPQLAVRVIRQLEGLEQLPEGQEIPDPAPPKPLKTKKLQGRAKSAAKQPLESSNIDGEAGEAGEAGESSAGPPPKLAKAKVGGAASKLRDAAAKRLAEKALLKPKPPKGPVATVPALRSFLNKFLGQADVQNTTLGMLKRAAFEEFGELNAERQSVLQDMAVAAMQKRLAQEAKAKKAKKKRVGHDDEEVAEDFFAPGNAPDVPSRLVTIEELRKRQAEEKRLEEEEKRKLLQRKGDSDSESDISLSSLDLGASDSDSAAPGTPRPLSPGSPAPGRRPKSPGSPGPGRRPKSPGPPDSPKPGSPAASTKRVDEPKEQSRDPGGRTPDSPKPGSLAASTKSVVEPKEQGRDPGAESEPHAMTIADLEDDEPIGASVQGAAPRAADEPSESVAAAPAVPESAAEAPAGPDLAATASAGLGVPMDQDAAPLKGTGTEPEAAAELDSKRKQTGSGTKAEKNKAAKAKQDAKKTEPSRPLTLQELKAQVAEKNRPKPKPLSQREEQARQASQAYLAALKSPQAREKDKDKDKDKPADEKPGEPAMPSRSLKQGWMFRDRSGKVTQQGDDQMLLKILIKKRRAEVEEQKRQKREVEQFEKIRQMLGKFVQHSLVNAKRHERLLKAGHLYCHINVPASNWTESLEAKVRELATTYTGQLIDSKHVDPEDLKEPAPEKATEGQDKDPEDLKDAAAEKSTEVTSALQDAPKEAEVAAVESSAGAPSVEDAAAETSLGGQTEATSAVPAISTVGSAADSVPAENAAIREADAAPESSVGGPADAPLEDTAMREANAAPESSVGGPVDAPAEDTAMRDADASADSSAGGPTDAPVEGAAKAEADAPPPEIAQGSGPGGAAAAEDAPNETETAVPHSSNGDTVDEPPVEDLIAQAAEVAPESSAALPTDAASVEDVHMQNAETAAVSAISTVGSAADGDPAENAAMREADAAPESGVGVPADAPLEDAAMREADAAPESSVGGPVDAPVEDTALRQKDAAPESGVGGPADAPAEDTAMRDADASADPSAGGPEIAAGSSIDGAAAAGSTAPIDAAASEEAPAEVVNESNKEDAHKEASTAETRPPANVTPSSGAAPDTPAVQGGCAPAGDGKLLQPRQPLRKMLLKFDAASFELFMSKHPHVVDATDAKIRSFAEQFVEMADLSNVKVGAFLQSVEDRFGEQRAERSVRTKAMLIEAVSNKVKNDDKEKADQLKGKDKSRGAQVAVKMMTQAPTGKKRMKEEQDEGAVALKHVQDIQWAATLLAPLGLNKDGGLLAKPPMQVALPVLRGLRVIEAWQTGKAMSKMLKETKIGRIVHGLRKHPEPEVVKLAKELEIALRYACSKEAAIKAEAAEAAAAAAAAANEAQPEAKRQKKA